MKRDMAAYDWQACPCEPLGADKLAWLINECDSLTTFGADDIAEAVEVIRRTLRLAAILHRYPSPLPAAGIGPAEKPDA